MQRFEGVRNGHCTKNMSIEASRHLIGTQPHALPCDQRDRLPPMLQESSLAKSALSEPIDALSPVSVQFWFPPENAAESITSISSSSAQFLPQF